MPVKSAASAHVPFVIIAVPLKLINDMPVAEMAGKIVLDTNNYMPWRDGSFPVINTGEKTVHELRHEQLPTSRVAKAFSHIQAPNLFVLANPVDPRARHALSVSSNYLEAVALVTRLYDQFGFDTVDTDHYLNACRSQSGRHATPRLALASCDENLLRHVTPLLRKQRRRPHDRLAPSAPPEGSSNRDNA